MRELCSGMREIVVAAGLHHSIEQPGTGAPLSDAVQPVCCVLRMEPQGRRVKRRQVQVIIGKYDAVPVHLMFHIPEQTFLLAPALHEIGIAFVELGDIGQQRIFL
ncbi:hypothetical protein D3C87_1682920 [compost metagenome]